MSFLQIPIGTYPNTFLGYQSSIGITTGTGDTAFGYLTLNANTTGSNNSAFGSEALRFNVSGSRNTAGGANALQINNANNNTAFGYASQRGNVNGQDNSSFGHDSMRAGDDGNENSAFGSGALYNAANTQGNSGFGYLSLYNVTSGLKNSAFGWASGSLITTGSKNSILGSYSGNQGGLDIRTLSNYIVLSDGDGNPRLWIDNTGAVNIPGGFVLPGGTANGVLYLNGSKVVTSGSSLTFDGSIVSNTGVGFNVNNANALYRFQNGSGTRTGYLQVRADAFEVWSDQAAVPMVFGVANAEQMRLTSTGLGIGTSSPNAKLEVNGNAILGAEVYRSVDTSYLRLAGGNPAATGANVIVFGSTHATAPGRVSINAVGTGHTEFSTGGAERMRLDSSGNLGLGVTPSAWSVPTLQLPTEFAVGQLGVSKNAYYDGAWKYITTGLASVYQQGVGIHAWYTAPSGTAGNAISFSQVMTLNASGGLSVGNTIDPGAYTLSVGPRNTSSDDAVIRIDGGSGAGGEAILALARNSVTNFLLVADGTANEIRGVANVPLTFRTNDQERARIPAAGGMVVGTAALATSDTDGFLYVPTCAGTPTGTPTTQTGTAPIVVDTTNNKLYFYSGGAWRDAGP